MRRILNAICLPGACCAAARHAATAAQTYDPRHPVCIEIYTIDGRSIDCSFASIAQCAATASGQSAQCYANPYATQAGSARFRRRRDGTDSISAPLSGRG